MTVGCPSPPPDLPLPPTGALKKTQTHLSRPQLCRDREGKLSLEGQKQAALVATHFYALLQGGFPLPVKLAFGSPSACYVMTQGGETSLQRVCLFPSTGSDSGKEVRRKLWTE